MQVHTVSSGRRPDESSWIAPADSSDVSDVGRGCDVEVVPCNVHTEKED